MGYAMLDADSFDIAESHQAIFYFWRHITPLHGLTLTGHDFSTPTTTLRRALRDHFAFHDGICFFISHHFSRALFLAAVLAI